MGPRMPESVAEIDNPDYENLYAHNNQINYLEILQYPSQHIQRLEGELKDDRSLEDWLVKDLTVDGNRPDSGIRILLDLVANSYSTGRG
ncbi:hypothetical protein BOTCAL_0321g00180 [Botryotinia calthae]|uniref:Uncharacterized protein n=1 Tax=Botryotinia calthae TaxID=38488 RepID=A0A4Y8CWA4_9HELO|nr:hypothetical protein BOTCAL_0321g00180 [Botryotinia calthae]